MIMTTTTSTKPSKTEYVTFPDGWEDLAPHQIDILEGALSAELDGKTATVANIQEYTETERTAGSISATIRRIRDRGLWPFDRLGVRVKEHETIETKGETMADIKAIANDERNRDTNGIYRPAREFLRPIPSEQSVIALTLDGVLSLPPNARRRVALYLIDRLGEELEGTP